MLNGLFGSKQLRVTLGLFVRLAPWTISSRDSPAAEEAHFSHATSGPSNQGLGMLKELVTASAGRDQSSFAAYCI